MSCMEKEEKASFCLVPSLQNALLCSVISTFSPVGSLSSNGIRMRVFVYIYASIARNELICGYANVEHT